MPVKFTSIEDQTAYWKFEDKQEVHLGSFHLEPNTVYENEKGEKKDRLYFEFYAQAEWGFTYSVPCYSVVQAIKIK